MLHVLASKNPHVPRIILCECVGGNCQRHFDCTYLLPKRFNGQCYLIFREQVIPEFIQDVPIAIRNYMRFQHDRTLDNLNSDVHNFLNDIFGPRWIGSGKSVPRPPQSPDLSSL